jgi:hypothetical protein
MRPVGRLLFGFRDDIDLNQRWWHRLAKVVSVLLFICIAALAGFIWHVGQVTGWNAASWVFLAAMAILNLYYRGIVFIICGPRDV